MLHCTATPKEDKKRSVRHPCHKEFTPASLEFWKTVPKLAQTKRYEGFGFEFGVENDELRRDYMQAYHACISFIDAQIGAVLDALKKIANPKHVLSNPLEGGLAALEIAIRATDSARNIEKNRQ